MKAIILARVSTEEQKEAGNSLPAQIRRGEEYCQRKNFIVTKKQSFDESAYKDKRDAFDEILETIKKSKEKLIICFDKIDRFSRNVFDKRVAKLYELAMADKIELHFVSDNLIINKDISAADKFHFSMSLGLAKYYSDAISDNTRRAFEQKRRNGEWTTQAPLGYLNTENPNGSKDIILDPQRAYHIQKIYELYATGNYSVKTLLAEITRNGLNTRKNSKVTPSMLHAILKNKFYIGIMTCKGKEYPHKYPTIISQTLFDRVQQTLVSHGKRPVQYGSKPFAFRGLIKCDNCGCSVTPEIKKKPSGKVYVYYSCTNYKGNCKKIYVNEKSLLEPVYELLERIQMPQERIDAIVNDLKVLNETKNEYHQKNINSLQQEYNKLQKSDDRLLDLRIDDSITQDIYDKKHKEIKERQHRITIQMEEYTQADEAYHITANTVFSLANRAKEIFESSEPNEKRQLLNFLLQNCRLSGKSLVFEVRSPFNVIAETSHQPLLLLGQDSNL